MTARYEVMMATVKAKIEQAKANRRGVIELWQANRGQSEIAKRMGLSKSYVQAIISQHKKEEAAKPVLASLMMGRIDGKLPDNGKQVKGTTIAETGPLTLTGEPTTATVRPATGRSISTTPRVPTATNRYAMLEDLTQVWGGLPEDVKQAFMLLEGLVKKA